MSKLLKKTIAVTTSVTTILSLSGVALFAPAFVFAATIVDGDTITTADSFDIYIVKHTGDKKFKRLILNPEVFESYGHLTWDGVKTVTQAEQDVYTTSELVRAVGDPKVYKLTSEPNSDTGVKSWVNMTAAEFVSEGYDWDSIYEINTTDRDNYTAGTDTVPAGVTPVAGAVSVSLASDSPAASSVALSASNVSFAKVNFTGGSAASTITAITVSRAGLAADADITDVKIWDGATQLGSTQALNTTTHKAVFTGLGWVVPANSTKVLTITATIAASGTATVGDAPRFGIGATTDIVGPSSVTGTFPAYGSAMTIAGVSVGNLDVTVRSVPADNSPISGSTDQEIASWTFAAISEGMSVRSVKLTQVGSAANADISNMKLKIGGSQIGSTLAALAADGTATFDLSSAPLAINSGASKIVYVHADIAAGIVTSRTARFEVTNAADVTAFGANSGGSVTITYNSGSQAQTFTTQTGAAQTISQATALTVTSNGGTNPSAQTFVRGSTGVLISAFRFSAGAGEGQRVSRLKLTLGGTGAGATDISNVTLYKYDEATGVETLVGNPTSFVGTTATYGANTSGLDSGVFDVAESSNVVLHVRADVSAAASWTTLGIFINEARVDGLQSQGDIGTATITAVDALSEVTNHSASASVGTLTMAVSPSNPSAQNVVPGTLGYTFGKFDFTMANEAAILSSLTVNLCDGAACSAGSAGTAEAADLTSVKLWNGSTLLGTVASPSTAATFSLNLTLPKSQTVTLSVTADIPTNAVSSSWASDIAAVAIDADLTATGVSSGATVSDPSADVVGNAMTGVAESLTVAFQSLPASTVVLNASDVVVSKVVLIAGTVGDVRVSSIKFSADDATGLSTTSAADTSLLSLRLYDGSTLLGGPKSFTSGTPDEVTFSGFSLNVPKGTQKLLELKANAAVAGTFYVGFADLTATATDIVGTGSSSNSTVYGTGTDADDSGALTISSAGTLTVAVDAATPQSAFVAVGAVTGKTGVEFAKFKLTANNEPIDVESIVVSLAVDNNTATDNNDVPNFSSLQLTDGTNSSVVYPTGTNDSAAQTYTFTYSPTKLTIGKNSSTVLTLKAALNGTSNGANSTTTPNFYIADVAGSTDGSASSITARGVDSGSRLTASAGTPNPSTLSSGQPSNINAMTVVRSKPTFALCTASNCSSASPSGALIPGVAEVIRFKVTAEGADVVFDSNSNIRFTIAQSGGTTTARAANIYEVGKTSVIATALSYNLTTSSGVLDFSSSLSSTISSGTSKEYYVTVDLQDYATTGETFRLSIANASADVSWDDGVSADVTNSPALSGLTMTGGTLVK